MQRVRMFMAMSTDRPRVLQRKFLVEGPIGKAAIRQAATVTPIFGQCTCYTSDMVVSPSPPSLLRLPRLPSGERDRCCQG